MTILLILLWHSEKKFKSNSNLLCCQDDTRCVPQSAIVELENWEETPFMKLVSQQSTQS